MNRALSKTKVKMKTILVIVLIFIGGIQSFLVKELNSLKEIIMRL